MSNTKHTTDADNIRAALKTAGYSARAVTVRQSGQTVRVTVRTGDVSVSAVREIADRFALCRTDERTGEILGGGNCFVHVDYCDTVTATVAAGVKEVLDRAQVGTVVEIAGERVTVGEHEAYRTRSGLLMFGAGRLASTLAGRLIDAAVTAAAKVAA